MHGPLNVNNHTNEPCNKHANESINKILYKNKTSK